MDCFAPLAMAAEASIARDPCVYIMASQPDGALYTGVTSNLNQRVFQHRTGALPGFTKCHGCKMLV